MHIAQTVGKSQIQLPAEEPTTLKTIYSNLGKKTNAYKDSNGWVINGPNEGAGFTQFVAMPFTPISDSHVSQVLVAVQYDGSGANQVNLSLYADSGNGYPGTIIAGPITVANLPDFGTCCILAVAKFPSAAVTAGTQYWVVADTPASGTGSDLGGVWDFVTTNIPEALNTGGGWFAVNGTCEGTAFFFGATGPCEPAGAVFGSIP